MTPVTPVTEATAVTMGAISAAGITEDMSVRRAVMRLIARPGCWCGLVVALILLAPEARAASKSDSWQRLTTPEFTVITSLKEKEAAAWAAEFAQYVAALRIFFNVKEGRLSPLTVVLFARERDFEQYRPLGANGKPQAVAGFFLRHDSWAVAGLGGAQQDEEVRRTIFHEGVHWFLSGQERPNPVWLEEGLAEVFSTFDVAGNQAEWGRAIDNHVALLNHTEMLPLERLLYTAHGDLFGDDSMHTSIVYAESWAFVHYLIFGKHDIPRHAFADYAALAHSGISPDQAFVRAFGKTYKEMDRQLANYLGTGRYFMSHVPLVAAAAPQTAPATPLEVDDALGRLALAGRRWALAGTHARAAIAAAPDDPRGHEVLGFSLQGSGDAAGALAEFALATERGTRDFRPYFELASAAQTAGSVAIGSLTLSPAEARQVANRYEQAINLHAFFIPSYQNLAGVIPLVEPLTPEDRKFFEQGRRIYPGDSAIKLGLAIVTRREGDRAAARVLLDEVLAAETGAPGTRAYANRIDETWEQQDVMEELNRLVAARNFSGALALIDERLAHGVTAMMRTQLLIQRRQLQTAALSDQIQASLKEHRWADARRLLGEMIASDGSPPMKLQARRTLDDLDRRHLGLGETKE